LAAPRKERDTRLDHAARGQRDLVIGRVSRRSEPDREVRLEGVVLAIGVLSISSIVFVIVDLSMRYRGVFHISSVSTREALMDVMR
jgi:hypothetical protein